MRPIRERISVVLLAAVVAAGCSESNPVSPSALGATPGGVLYDQESTNGSANGVTIIYAQGQDASGSLHVQWVGPLTCAVEVWYARNAPDVEQRIAVLPLNTFPRGEFTYRVPSEFKGGRYRVWICGARSRLMYLDGQRDDTVERPAPPVVPPSLPPAVVPPPEEVPPSQPPPLYCGPTEAWCLPRPGVE